MLDLRGTPIRSGSMEAQKIARERTLTVLRRLDAERKGSVLRFLHESGLIDKDKRIIDLSGANLSRADLSTADLWGADLSGAVLGEADLSHADLKGWFVKWLQEGGEREGEVKHILSVLSSASMPIFCRRL